MDATNTALQLKASQRQCAQLKEAYDSMAAELWEKDQMIERLQEENAELRGGNLEAAASTTPTPSSSFSSPVASVVSADSALVLHKPQRVRAKAKPRVPKERTPLEAVFEGVPFFDHFGVTNSHDLHQKLAKYLIARDPDVNTAEKRRTTTNQSKFKADYFLQLLWLEAPGTPRPYTPGNVDEFFAFLTRKDHDDMGKKRPFHSHDHRVGTWLWPSKVTDYASFQHESNKYVARQARGAMTGVRAVQGLYEIFRGNATWPVVDRAPLSEAAAAADGASPIKKRKARAKKPPVDGKRRKRASKKRGSTGGSDDDNEDEESYASSSGDESPEEDWSCADDDSDDNDK